MCSANALTKGLGKRLRLCRPSPLHLLIIIGDLNEQTYGNRSGFSRHNNEEEGEAPPPYKSPFDEGLNTVGGDSPSPFDSRFQSEFSPPVHGFSVELNAKSYVADGAFDHGEIGSASPPTMTFSYPSASVYSSGSLNGSVRLPPPEEMQAEEGFILREWKRFVLIYISIFFLFLIVNA